MKRTLSLILVLAMVFSMMLGVVPHATEETTTEESYKASANLMFADTVYLLVAVDCPESVTDPKTAVKLNITNNKTGASTVLAADESISIPSGYDVAFKYTELGAKNMGDELKIEILNGDTVVSTLTYSVLEYALRVENLGNEALSKVVSAMIKYGASAQKAFLESGKTIAEAYTYDLSVDHSLVRLVGKATFEGGAKKAILKSGETAAVNSNVAANTLWYKTTVQSLGVTGVTADLPYNASNYTAFAAPASVDLTDDKGIFDMDTYSDTEGLYYGDFSSDGKTEGWYIDDSEGNPVKQEGKDDYLFNSFKAVANPNSKYICYNGYLKLVNEKTSFYQSGYRWQRNVTQGITEAASDTSVDSFTISYTIAADGNGLQMFQDLCLRGSSSNSPERVYLLAGHSSNKIFSYYKTDFSEGKTDFKNHTPLTVCSSSVDGQPGQFVTIHMVINFKSLTLSYYLNDSADVVCTVKLPDTVTHELLGNGYYYLDGFLVKNATMYVKSLIITKGNITDNFK